MFNKFRNKKNNQSNSAWNDEWNLDRFWMPQELEYRHQNAEKQFRANENNPVKLGNIVNSLFDIRKEEISLLTVNDGITVTNFEVQEEIWDYNFLSVWHTKMESTHKLGTKQNHVVVMTLFYRGFEQKEDKDKSIGKRDGCLIIHLDTASGIREKVMYVQATFCHPPIDLERGKKGMLPQAKSLSVLMGYDYGNEREITEEFSKVWNSLLDNADKNKTYEELTLLERDLLNLYRHPLIARDYYMGKQVMQEYRFWDAISYFENAFNGLQKQWWADGLKDEEFKMLFETSFSIGYCYYELRLFEKAYKYLELPFRANDGNYNYFTEYVNCLERLQDIRVVDIIDTRLKELNKKMSEDRDENDYLIWLFCFRRMAYILIELKRYEEAKKYLEAILKDEPDNEFAQGEMEYIKSMTTPKNGFNRQTSNF